MKSRDPELLFIYLFFDFFILNVAILLVTWFSPEISPVDYREMALYLLQANLAWLLTYVIFSKQNLYLRDGFGNRFKRITHRTLVFLLVSVVIEFLMIPLEFLRMFFLEYTFLFYLGMVGFYWLFYLYLDARRRHGFNTKRALIIGVNDTCKHLRKLIDSNPILGYKFVGYVSDENCPSCDTSSDDFFSHQMSSSEVYGRTDDLAELIDRHQIQMVFVSLSLFGESPRGREFMTICNKKGIRMRFLPENQRWFKSRVNMESVGTLSLINPQEIPLDDIQSRFIKRTFDLVFSLLVIIFIFSWLVPILALIIKLSSKGPVFFVQERTGINNKTFKCFKFRSMQLNEQADEQQATVGDARITAIGRFMRKTNLDELPQFFNVLMSQMSVTGPRPHMLKHTDQYSKLIDYYLVRQYVKPGLTGWAQVNGHRGETDELWKMERRVEFDMNYIENWTFWWDMKIILQTVFDRRTFHNAG